MNEVEAMRIISSIATMIEGQKLSGGVLVPDAEGGWNLCCDFTADKLRKMIDMTNRKLLANVVIE